MPNQDHNSGQDPDSEESEPSSVRFDQDTDDYGELNDETVPGLLEQAKAGDEEAIQQLCCEHFDSLIRIARKKLQHEMLRHVDPEDVVQSAMRQFFKKASRFEEIGNAQHFWHLLVRMTRQKAIDYRRRHFAEKRGSGKTRGDSVFVNRKDLTGSFNDFESPVSTPEFEATAQDELDRLLNILDESDPDGKNNNVQSCCSSFRATQQKRSPRKSCAPNARSNDV
jgi:RNA polymerase sigma factor (sigma-70 family)